MNHDGPYRTLDTSTHHEEISWWQRLREWLQRPVVIAFLIVGGVVSSMLFGHWLDRYLDQKRQAQRLTELRDRAHGGPDRVAYGASRWSQGVFGRLPESMYCQELSSPGIPAWVYRCTLRMRDEHLEELWCEDDRCTRLQPLTCPSASGLSDAR